MKKSAFSITLLLTALACCNAAAHAGEKHFDGPYIAADVGMRTKNDTQFAGFDFRTVGSFYYSGAAGWRTQTDSGWVFGFEGVFGDIKGYEIQIRASSLGEAPIRNLWSLNSYAGRTFGNDKKNLLYLGGGFASLRAGSETTVNGVRTRTSDPGGGYRLLAGYERALWYGVNFRLQTSYANFKYESDILLGTLGFSYNF
jgi:Outer membrane protein beta-barrel domain